METFKGDKRSVQRRQQPAQEKVQNESAEERWHWEERKKLKRNLRFSIITMNHKKTPMGFSIVFPNNLLADQPVTLIGLEDLSKEKPGIAITAVRVIFLLQSLKEVVDWEKILEIISIKA
ncbi:hypothetical protein DUI87_15650 [Hirundo rustica rustica]|uniref:Uncharacterized protein n=1 Tax=Hirundo rustica rustica TaxID=333673 RepID=A0A3M0K572_HIRRU|nr:hypothetical protein DUI87_15650 [Hirundo rustica rustica]